MITEPKKVNKRKQIVLPILQSQPSSPSRLKHYHHSKGGVSRNGNGTRTAKQQLDCLMLSINKFKGNATSNETEVQKIKRGFDSQMMKEGVYNDYVLKTMDLVR